MAVTCLDCCKVIFCLLFPPIAVFLERGCGCSLLINCALCLLGWLPGQIHAFFVVLSGHDSKRSNEPDQSAAQQNRADPAAEASKTGTPKSETSRIVTNKTDPANQQVIETKEAPPLAETAKPGAP